MENQLRELIFPLVDNLIIQLNDSIVNRDKKLINFFWIEVVVWRILTTFAANLIAGLIKLLFERGYEGSFRACSCCDQRMKFQRYSPRSIITTFGPTSFLRAYYYCSNCKNGFCPLDEQLQLGSRQISPRLQRIIGVESAHLSFGVVEKNILESFDLLISDEAIRQVSQQLGQQAKDWEDQQALSYLDKPLPSKPQSQSKKTWILEIDGKMVGFQDGSWSEVKVGVIYELAHRVEPYGERKELLKRELVARRCGWREFVPLFWAAMQRAGIREGDHLVAIADAAEGIESIFEFLAPQATRIRDFYHVAERIYAVGELRYGVGSKEAEQYIKVQLNRLKQSEVSRVIKSLTHLKFDREEEKVRRDQAVRYIEKNRKAMDYGKYEEEGLPLGSGAVEGGCKLIGYRTNGCGRRWEDTGCDKIVALRAAVLNDRLGEILPKPVIEELAA